jgi:hypothetical protein
MATVERRLWRAKIEESNDADGSIAGLQGLARRAKHPPVEMV